MPIEIEAKAVCDECGDEEEIELTRTITSHPSWDARNVAGRLKQVGWEMTTGVYGEETILCEKCLDEKEGSEEEDK